VLTGKNIYRYIFHDFYHKHVKYICQLFKFIGYYNLTNLKLMTESVDKLKLVYNDFIPSLQKIDKVLPAAPETPVEFIDFLEETARDSGVKMKISATSFDQRNQNQWSFFTFQMGVSGNFFQTGVFLAKLENAPYLINIQSVNINQAGGENQVETNLNLLIYTR